MEALSFLKHWRTTRGAVTVGDSNSDARDATKTIVSAAAVIPYFSDGEDGSYFDLEFALPDNIDNTNEEEDEVSDSENEDELKFAVLSNEESAKLSLSDEDELFISSDNLQELRDNSEDNSKSPVPKSKFWVLLLKLKKPKSGNGVLEKSENMEKNDEEEDNGDDGQESSAGGATPKIEETQGKAKGKFFTVKFNVAEVKLQLVSMFARDYNSSKENNNDKEIKADDERKLTKEMLQKYFKMVKPLYFHVAKNYVGKLKRSGMPRGGGAVPHTCSAADKGGEVVEVAAAARGGMRSNNQKQRNNSSDLQAGLKVVRKHLGKIRSASATVAVATPGKAAVVPDRRDDSMLQVQDGIQGAILHCKRSFNSSNDEESSSTCGSVPTASTSTPHI